MAIRVSAVTKNGQRRFVVDVHAAGKRWRRFFPNRTLADQEAARVRAGQERSGNVWMSMSARERDELVQVWQEVQAAGLTMREVWAQHQRRAPRATDRTWGQAIEELLAAKRTAGRSIEYLGNLESQLRQFAAGREAAVMAPEAAEVQAWCNAPGLSAWTRATRLNRLSTLFSFAVRQGFLEANPCDRMERARIPWAAPEVLTLEQCRQALAFTRAHHARSLGWLVLALLAGARPREAERIEWADIDLARGLVRVEAMAAKVRDRRVIHLTDAARAWLAVAQAADAALPMPAESRRRYIRALRVELGFAAWPKDILRKTAASNLLAAWQDVERVRAELGNSARVLLWHYRELVSTEEGTRWVKELVP